MKINVIIYASIIKRNHELCACVLLFSEFGGFTLIYWLNPDAESAETLQIQISQPCQAPIHTNSNKMERIIINYNWERGGWLCEAKEGKVLYDKKYNDSIWVCW